MAHGSESDAAWIAAARRALAHNAEGAVTAAYAIVERVDSYFLEVPARSRALTKEEVALMMLRRQAVAAMRYLRDRADSLLDYAD